MRRGGYKRSFDHIVNSRTDDSKEKQKTLEEHTRAKKRRRFVKRRSLISNLSVPWSPPHRALYRLWQWEVEPEGKSKRVSLRRLGSRGLFQPELTWRRGGGVVSVRMTQLVKFQKYLTQSGPVRRTRSRSRGG